jgi:hypothetical protein
VHPIQKTAAGYLAGLAALFMAAAASAQVLPDQGTWLVGAYAGVYQPTYNFLDDTGTGGLRLGYAAAEKVMVTLGAGAAKIDTDDSALRGDVEVTVFDVNTSYILGGGNFGLELIVGGGYAWVDSGISEAIDDGFDVCEEDCSIKNSWTLSAGLGPVMKLGPVNIHPQYRWRYFLERNDDEIDGEFAAAVMIPLGGR